MSQRNKTNYCSNCIQSKRCKTMAAIANLKQVKVLFGGNYGISFLCHASEVSDFEALKATIQREANTRFPQPISKKRLDRMQFFYRGKNVYYIYSISVNWEYSHLFLFFFNIFLRSRRRLHKI